MKYDAHISRRRDVSVNALNLRIIHASDILLLIYRACAATSLNHTTHQKGQSFDLYHSERPVTEPLLTNHCCCKRHNISIS